MYKIKYALMAIVAIVAFSSCKEKTDNPADETPIPAETSAKVTMQFYNEVSGADVEFGKMQYMSPAGNIYQIDLLKYYISKISLVKSDNTEHAISNIELINAADLATCLVDAGNVPNGTYTKIKFNIGVPLDRNHSGAQDGDLDAALGMIWDWNTGYVFFKHEGKYKNTSSVEKSLIFHFATDRAFSNVEVPLTTNLVVAGVAKKVSLIFDLNKLYSTPTNIDFNIDNNRQSSSAADFPWIDNMKASFSDAFSLYKIE